MREEASSAAEKTVRATSWTTLGNAAARASARGSAKGKRRRTERDAGLSGLARGASCPIQHSRSTLSRLTTMRPSPLEPGASNLDEEGATKVSAPCTRPVES